METKNENLKSAHNVMVNGRPINVAYHQTIYSMELSPVIDKMETVTDSWGNEFKLWRLNFGTRNYRYVLTDSRGEFKTYLSGTYQRIKAKIKQTRYQRAYGAAFFKDGEEIEVRITLVNSDKLGKDYSDYFCNAHKALSYLLESEENVKKAKIEKLKNELAELEA